MLDKEETRGLRSTFRIYNRITAMVERAWITPDYSRPERRVILQVGMSPGSPNRDIAAALGMDDGQLSISLKKLIDRGLLASEPSLDHKRQKLHILSESGEVAFKQLKQGLDRALHEAYNSEPAHVREVMLRSMGMGVNDPLTSKEHPVSLRALAPEDAAWLFSHLLALRPGNQAYVVEIANRVSAFFRNPGEPGDWGWVIMRFDGPLALCTMILDRGQQFATVYIDVVNHRGRGKGLEKRLLETVIMRAKACGLSHLAGWATASQATPGGHWREMGFKVGKGRVRPSDYSPDEVYREVIYRVPAARGRPPKAQQSG